MSILHASMSISAFASAQVLLLSHVPIVRFCGIGRRSLFGVDLQRYAIRRLGIVNIRRPVIHTHEEAFAKKIESMPGVLNVHRNVRVHRNYNGRQRREVDLAIVMSRVVLVAELKHLYGTVTFEEETGFYVKMPRNPFDSSIKKSTK